MKKKTKNETAVSTGRKEDENEVHRHCLCCPYILVLQAQIKWPGFSLECISRLPRTGLRARDADTAVGRYSALKWKKWQLSPNEQLYAQVWFSAFRKSKGDLVIPSLVDLQGSPLV